MSDEQVPPIKDSVKETLDQIRDLLVLQLRSAKVDDSAIGHVLGVKAKTVKNKCPLTKTEREEPSFDLDQRQQI